MTGRRCSALTLLVAFAFLAIPFATRASAQSARPAPPGSNALRRHPPGHSRAQADVVPPGRAEEVLARRRLTGGNPVANFGAEITPEIAEQARALRNDPVLLYEFVRNRIDTVPIYGSIKGATMTLLDGKGNDFDQTSLLIALARAAGFNASYIYGTIRLSATQIESWLGAGTNPDVIGALLGSAGIPAQIFVNPNGSLAFVDLSHVWAKITIGGTNFVFDPSVKTYLSTPGIDLASAMGYDQATFLTRATQSATVDPDFVQNLNRGNIRSDLAAFADNLIDHIRTNMPAASLGEVIGGREIQLLRNEALRTTLPYERSRDQEFSDIPGAFDVLIRIQHLGIDQTLPASTTYGKRLTIFYNTSHAPELRLDGTLLATGSAATPGSLNSITLTVDHPYAALGGSYADQTFTTSIEADGDFVIMNGFAGTTRALVERHRKAVLTLVDAGEAVDSESLRGETLTVFSLSWLAQVSESEGRLDGVAKTMTIQHHTLGFAGQLESPFVDIPMALVSVVSTEEDPEKEDAVFFAQAGVSSAFEWGIFEQSQDHSAVCTVKLLDDSNAASDKIFDTTAANYVSTVRPQLVNYSSGELALVEAHVNAGFRLALPQNGSLNELQWTGMAFITVSPGENSIGHIISGSLSGGFGSEAWGADPSVIIIIGNQAYFPDGHVQTLEPIDLVTGNYLYDHTDLTIGSDPFPLGLGFARSYSSGARLSNGPVGLGWTHNFDVSARLDTDGFQGLGEDSPIDAAAAIVELYVAHDILRGPKTIVRLITATLAHRWFLEQLIDNVVMVREGAATRQFVELPDGSYNPPPGMADQLTKEMDGTFLLRSKVGVVMDFDSAGKLVTWRDPNDNVVTLTYAGGKLQTVGNSASRTLTLGYSGDRVSSVSDGTGRSVAYGYDVDGNLTAFTDPELNVTTYEYDVKGRLRRIFFPAHPADPFVTNTYDSLERVATQTDGAGNTYTYLFSGLRSEERNPAGNSRVVYLDRRGKTIIDIDPLGNETRFAYDGQSRLVRRTYPENNAIEFQYDPNHNVTRLTLRPKPPSGSPPIVREFTYEPTFNRVATSKDSQGRTTNYSYDAQGNLIRIERPLVNGQTPTAQFTYNARGQATTETDPLGKLTTYSYDGATGDLLSITDDAFRLDLTTQMTYDAVGNRVTVTNPLNLTSLLAYDARRLLRQNTAPSPLSFLTRFTFDGNGNLTLLERETGQVGNPWQTTQTTYTLTDKENTTISPQGNVTQLGYDGVDRLSRVTDAEGAIQNYHTDYAYDAASRIFQVVDALGHVAEERAYTANGRKRTVKDANGRITTHTYDEFDRLKRVTFPGGSFEEMTYDAAGHVIQKRTRAGHLITFTYDSQHRLATKTAPGIGTTQYSYDLAGRVTDVTDTTGGIHYDYDTAGRLLRVVHPDSSVVQYGYDALGRRTRLTYPDGYFVTYQYDNMNRLTDILESGTTLLAHYDYDPLSRRVSVTCGNGTSTSYAYEIDDDLLTVANQFSGGSESLSYTYDRVGNRTSLITPQRAEMYDYDPTYRLTNVATTPGSPAAVAYQLDPAGNRISVTEDSATTAYATNVLNQYTTVGGVPHTYDANGNLTSDGFRRLSYDSENRLISASTRRHKVTFSYDALGRRVSKLVVPVPPTERTLPVPSGHHPETKSITNYVHDLDRVIAEYDGNTGNLLRRYVYGPGIDEPIVLQTGGATYTYHFDGLGSVTALTNAAGQVVEQYRYGAYGQPVTVSSVGNPYLFTGRHFDVETGLYYHRARYYDPEIGRFVQVDPIGSLGGLNLYSYAQNNPINLLDPFGLAPTTSDRLWQVAGAAGMVGASFIPGVGEAMDLYTLFASDSAWWERGLSLLSLGANVLTAGAAPNFGAIARAGRVADDLAAVGVQANRTRGLAAEARVADDLLAEGNVLLGSHVSVNTSSGRRVIDHLIQTPDGTIIAIEVKSGGAVRNSSQLAKDALMATEGGVMVGRNAPDALRGQTVIITTIERRVP